MINGVKPATFFVLPMLGKHPDEYPRFRDCFIGDDERPELKDHIHVYTRTGGGNREGYEVENQAMREMPGFVTDYDDGFDCTFASWVFRVPERWKADLSAATAATINQSRQAIMMQSLIELDARGGTRYVEILKSHFNVISPDFRLQRPESLSSGRTMMSQLIPFLN